MTTEPRRGEKGSDRNEAIRGEAAALVYDWRAFAAWAARGRVDGRERRWLLLHTVLLMAGSRSSEGVPAEGHARVECFTGAARHVTLVSVLVGATRANSFSLHVTTTQFLGFAVGCFLGWGEA